MADEATIFASVRFVKGSTVVELGADNLQVDVSGNQFAWQRQSVGTSEEAIDIGEVSTGGYFCAINRDPTNFVSIRQATGGTDFIRLNAGEVCCFRIHASSVAPFWIADTAVCQVEFLLLPA